MIQVSRKAAIFAGLLAVVLAAGCGGSTPGQHRSDRRPDRRQTGVPQTAERERTDDRPTRSIPKREESGQPEEQSWGIRPPAGPASASPRPPAESATKNPDPPVPGKTPGGPNSKEPPRTLADLLGKLPDSPNTMIPGATPRAIDDANVAAAGIRKLKGRHLTLYTDLPSSLEVDVLPQVFDQAFPKWCQYFNVSAQEHADWHMTGCIMKDKRPFLQAGLLPAYLPPFDTRAFCYNYDLWVHEQPSVYYRRHLLLHEGTHGFMNTVLGSCGPPWYMEGMAELLATHRWAEGKLTMAWMPPDREAVPMWGRIRIVQDNVAEGRANPLFAVIEYSHRAHQHVEAYAWSWAAATLLDGHPRYQRRFRELYKYVMDPQFTERFYRMMGDDWPDLAEEFDLFAANLEYGYNVERTAIDFAPGRPLPAAGARVVVAADRGWQNAGVRLEAGRTYGLTAAGRYQVDDEPRIWWCEPNGVSIRYYQGRPLGILLAAVRPDRLPRGARSPLLDPVPVGLGTTLTPAGTGTLFLKINDSGGELTDNAGSLQVGIQPQ